MVMCVNQKEDQKSSVPRDSFCSSSVFIILTSVHQLLPKPKAKLCYECKRQLQQNPTEGNTLSMPWTGAKRQSIEEKENYVKG